MSQGGCQTITKHDENLLPVQPGTHPVKASLPQPLYPPCNYINGTSGLRKRRVLEGVQKAYCLSVSLLQIRETVIARGGGGREGGSHGGDSRK